MIEQAELALAASLPIEPGGRWCLVKDGDSRARQLHQRHYSKYKYVDGRESKLFVGPGGKFVMITGDNAALFVWRKFINDAGQTGINCAVFRNEGTERSSSLIEEADRIAWAKWPTEPRHYTYVNGARIRSSNPGYCFLAAGWKRAGKSKGGLHILAIAGRSAQPHD